MTEAEKQLILVRGVIASLPEDTRATVKTAESQIRAVLAAYPEGEALVALALIGAEEAAKK